jgi:biotin operon repressor
LSRCLAALFHPVLYPSLGDRLAVSQEEIAYLVGVSRQRVNRSLKLLQERGFLVISYGGITIQNLNGLRSFGS